MVAKIKIGKSIRGILRYNENKIAEGQACLILASGFAGDIDKMNFENKVKRFKHLTDLKPSVKTNALHISLNFEASEQIDNTKIQQIALAYMEQIGFGDQPFLVYRHNDVAHQHIHIATTSIQRNGRVINLHNIGRLLSEPARKQIEKDFNLIVAESKKFKPQPAIKAIQPTIINYGHIPTKRAINNVITAIVDNYTFTSLAELNAILKQFNVLADRGSEETEMYQKKGLKYSILNLKGEKISVPIKASSFYNKPTLKNLEMKFVKNLEKRKPYKQQLIRRIDQTLDKYHTLSENTLLRELKARGIELALRKNEKGLVYGATFIDHIHKTVFNGSDLGKSYSAKNLVEMMTKTDRPKLYLSSKSQETNYLRNGASEKTYLPPLTKTNFLEELLNKTDENFAPSIGRTKKKKRRGFKK